MDALAAQLETELAPHVTNLQVVGRMTFNPTDPCIDIYPDDPFQEASGFGEMDTDLHFVVRARVSTVDHEGAQDMLLALMDPTGDASVRKAVSADKTIGGTVQDAVCFPPSDFAAFVAPAPSKGALLGCTWSVTVTL